MGTELSYLADSASGYVREFTARVVALPPGAVVLDRTYFYPVGGGQPADRGELRRGDGGRVPIVDVAKSGPAVIHRVGRRSEAGGSLSLGEEVRGVIDWDRRYRHMRLHTAQHLLSARLFTQTGRRTASARLQDDAATLDLEPPALTSEWGSAAVLAELERYRDRDLPVRIRLLPRSEYDRDPGDRSGLVALPPHVDPVRVVEIEAADRCPCGGTHLARTAEIGPVVSAALEPLATGGTRVRFRLAAADPPTPPG